MYFKKRGCFSGRKKTVNVWVWIFLRFFFRRLEDLEDSRKEMYGQHPRCFKSVFRIDFYPLQFQSSIFPYTQCALLLFLYSYFYHAFSVAPQEFQIYFIFNFYPRNPPRGSVIRSSEWNAWKSIDENDVPSRLPLTKSIDENGLTGIWKRERRPDTTLHELLSSAGFGLSPWNLFELFTRAGYTRAPCMPQDAAIILRNASVTPTIPRVMSSTIHSQMARNPILSLPCTNLALCARVGKFIGATLSTC